jgi:hypothetical protein
VLPAIDRIDALIAGVTRAEIQKMPPIHRQRLAQALRHVADLCDPPAPPEKQKPVGVLADLGAGARTE